jgi:heat shock protein HslJ
MLAKGGVLAVAERCDNVRMVSIGILTVVLLAMGPAPARLAAAPAAQVGPGIPPFVWSLSSLPGVGPIAEPARYTVQFLADGNVGIGADCNRAIGSWTGGAGALDITLGLSTLALCPPDSLAEPFLQALDGVSGYTLSGTTLTLHGATGDLVFTI